MVIINELWRLTTLKEFGRKSLTLKSLCPERDEIVNSYGGGEETDQTRYHKS